MKPRFQVKLVAVVLLALLMLPGAARDADAIPIDNSVDIVWQNVKFLVEPAIVTGGNFTASLDVLDEILLTVLISGRPTEIQGFELILNVGSSLSEIEHNPSPFQLRYAAGENRTGGDFPYPADPYEVTGSTYEATLHLNQFQNYAPLVSQMQNGLPLAFSLDGNFFGDINAGGNLTPCNQLPEGQCPTWPGQVSLTVSGGTPASVPEPSSFALLLVGGAIAAGVRRRR